MGSDQSTMSEGALGSVRRFKQDASKLSTRRPIGEGSALPPSRSQTLRAQPAQAKSVDPGILPKHNIVVVADGSVTVKDPDPELTRLNTIPNFVPIIQSSLNLVNSPRDQEQLEKLDHRSLLIMALRYQTHLHMLADSVSFDQNSLCIRMKEVAHMIQVLQSRLADRQRKYQKSMEQFERVAEIVTTLDKVKSAVDNIVPCMNGLNQLLPDSERLEPCTLGTTQGNSSIQAS